MIVNVLSKAIALEEHNIRLNKKSRTLAILQIHTREFYLNQWLKSKLDYNFPKFQLV